MKNLFKRFIKDESGATAIEYGLIAALVAVALIGAMQFVTEGLTTAFTNIGGHLSSVPTAGTSD